jgi:predicted GTPase
MPYGDLEAARVQRFASISDMDYAHCTAEEREEYDSHISQGFVVFAGVDYAEILRAAESEADILIWDGGNNDFSFVRPTLQVTVADALRPRQIRTHHPGEAVARKADILVINKVDGASSSDVQLAKEELRSINAAAPIVLAASPVKLDDTAAVRGKRVVVIEDGPTLTHGGMSYGAGYVAARAAGAAAIVDPRGAASPAIKSMYAAYPHVGPVLPAVGYSAEQLRAVEETLNNADAEVVVSATPFDIARVLHIVKPVIRARYEYAETGEPKLSTLIDAFMGRMRDSKPAG